MIQKWQTDSGMSKMRLEWIQRVLSLIRDSTRLLHSDHILTTFSPIPSSFPFNGYEPFHEWPGMPKWRSNEGYPRIQFFFPSEKTPSFLPIRSIHCHARMFWMTRDENYNGEISFEIHSGHFQFIPRRLFIQEWGRNDGMRPNEVTFSNKGETLTFEKSLIPSPFRHSMRISFQDIFIPFILWSFRHSKLIQSCSQLQNHAMLTL